MAAATSKLNPAFVEELGARGGLPLGGEDLEIEAHAFRSTTFKMAVCAENVDGSNKHCGGAVECGSGWKCTTLK
jgi:hypothetical protein